MTIGRLAGFTVNAELSRALGATNVTINLDGAPGTAIEIPASALRDADPVRLITRLEHRLAQLETRKADALAEIDHARRQIDHARARIGEQFPHAEELTAASQRVREIGEALDRMAQQQPDHAATTGQETGSADSPQQAEAQLTEAVAGTAHLAATRSAHDIAAQREQDARQPAAAAEDTARMQANRAAEAASEAYKAGDLDRAGELTEQATALDPSRAGLWQQHRNDIAARRLIISARAAHAHGDHERAGKLVDDASQLAPVCGPCGTAARWPSQPPSPPGRPLDPAPLPRKQTVPPAPSARAPPPSRRRGHRSQHGRPRQPGESQTAPAWPQHNPAERSPQCKGLLARQARANRGQRHRPPRKTVTWPLAASAPGGRHATRAASHR